jgi:hypothetical protein
MVLAYIIAFYSIPSLLSLFLNNDGNASFDETFTALVLLFIAIGIIGIELAKLIISISRHRPINVVSHLLSLVFFGLAAVFNPTIIDLTRYLRLFLVPQVYNRCEQSAQSYDGADRFSVCSTDAFGNAFDRV